MKAPCDASGLDKVQMSARLHDMAGRTHMNHEKQRNLFDMPHENRCGMAVTQIAPLPTPWDESQRLEATETRTSKKTRRQTAADTNTVSQANE